MLGFDIDTSYRDISDDLRLENICFECKCIGNNYDCDENGNIVSHCDKCSKRVFFEGLKRIGIL